MAKGVMQQFATPEDIYHRPATGFVAGFIGKPNRLSGKVVSRNGAGGSVRLGAGLILPAGHVDAVEGALVDVVIRQEAVSLRRGRAESDALAGVVALRSFSGPRVQYVVKLTDDVELVAEAPSSGPDSALAIGSEVLLAIDPLSVFAMPVEAAK
jgi:putative spermidine/putrescine transport system ATP-binding protein